MPTRATDKRAIGGSIRRKTGGLKRARGKELELLLLLLLTSAIECRQPEILLPEVIAVW